MADMTGLVAGVRTQLAVLATSVADKLDEMDAAVAGAQGTIAGKVDDEGAPAPKSEGRRLYDEEAESPDDSPESVESLDEATEPEGYDEGADGGLTLDIDDTGEPEDNAGSAEIEGVLVDEEDEEI
jgi:hypothetical protein